MHIVTRLPQRESLSSPNYVLWIDDRDTRGQFVSENIVSEILVREGMPPEELAERVNESALTVAKWRQGEQIPTEVWKKLSEQFSWIKDPVNILCRNSEVAEGWRELLKNVAEPLDLDWEFSYWHLAYIAELLSDLGMDVTTSAIKQPQLLRGQMV